MIEVVIEEFAVWILIVLLACFGFCIVCFNEIRKLGVPKKVTTYRKPNGHAVWHYSLFCSHWPKDNFQELRFSCSPAIFYGSMFPPGEFLCGGCKLAEENEQDRHERRAQATLGGLGSR